MPRYRSREAAARRVVVYHVGERPTPGGRTSRAFSQEGGELSVSRHPDDWAAIARRGGGVWRLSKAGARLLQAPSSRATAWAAAHGYLEPATVYRVWQGVDVETGEETYFTCDSPGKAMAEATEYEDREPGEHGAGEIEAVPGYRFGPLGEAYWCASFDGPVDHNWAEDFVSIFYARAHGYDGVWFDERYDPVNLSCPRGLILQERLPEWTVTKVKSRLGL